MGSLYLAALYKSRNAFLKPICKSIDHLLSDDQVFGDSSPDQAVFLISSFESVVFYIGEWVPMFAPHFLEE